MSIKRWLTTFCSIGLVGGCFHALAHEPGSSPQAQPQYPAPPAPHSLHEAPVAMDPVMRAVLIAMAARMLREAAASPDPMTALGESLERNLAAAVVNPETVRMVEALTGQALKEVPEGLRNAIVAFAVSMLNNARREMLPNRSITP